MTIHPTHEANGVQYGKAERLEKVAFHQGVAGMDTSINVEVVRGFTGHQNEQFFKQVMANNRNVPNWVGVSEEEFELSKHAFAQRCAVDESNGQSVDK